MVVDLIFNSINSIIGFEGGFIDGIFIDVWFDFFSLLL